jgi:hypothetical protein
MPTITRSMTKILHQQGYVVYQNALKEFMSPTILQYFQEYMKQTADPIFNNKNNNDNLRRQSRLKKNDPKIYNWLLDIEDVLCSIHPLDSLQFKNWNVLQSLPGCKEQQSHTDYVPTKEFIEKMKEWDTPEKQRNIPLLCLIAIQPNTYIDIWKDSKGLIFMDNTELHNIPTGSIKKWRLCLQEGDVLFFRPDLIHAGSNFSEENIRLHVYLDNPDLYRSPNRTFIIQKHADHSLKRIFME